MLISVMRRCIQRCSIAASIGNIDGNIVENIVVNVDWTEIRYIFDSQLIILIKRDAATWNILYVWTPENVMITECVETTCFFYHQYEHYLRLQQIPSIHPELLCTGQNNLLKKKWKKKTERERKKKTENRENEDKTSFLMNENKLHAGVIWHRIRCRHYNHYKQIISQVILLWWCKNILMHRKPIESIGTVNDQWNSETYINYCYW